MSEEGTDNPAFEYALATTPAPEPVPYDDGQRLDTEVIQRLVEHFAGFGSVEDIGRAVAFAAFEMSVLPNVQTFQELAVFLGLSERQTFRLREKMSVVPHR